MKILFCTNKLEDVSNGPAKFATRLLQEATTSADHEVSVLTDDVRTPRAGVYKLPLNVPKGLSLFSQLFRIVQYYRHAKKIATHYKYDVIVYNNAFIGVLTALTGKHCLGMINDYNNASRSWRTLDWTKRSIKQYVFKLLERVAVANFNSIIVNSHYLQQRLTTVYGTSEDKFTVLYKGVDIGHARKFRPINPNGVISILFVKSDYLIGGLDTLVRACAQLTFRINLIIVGPKASEHQAIHLMIAGISKTVNYRILGRRTQAEVAALMQDADVFCVPSHKEALGVANLEALSFGLPVVSSDAGGIPEALAEGKAGWIAPVGDSSALAAALRECITDEVARRQKFHYAAAHLTKFDIKRTISNFFKIVDRAVG